MGRSSFISFVGGKVPGFKVMSISELNPDAREILKRNRSRFTYAGTAVSDHLKDSIKARDEL